MEELLREVEALHGETVIHCFVSLLDLVKEQYAEVRVLTSELEDCRQRLQILEQMPNQVPPSQVELAASAR